MSTINERVLETLKTNPGLTKAELVVKLSEGAEHPVTEKSLKLGDLGLQGLVRSERQLRPVERQELTSVYFAVEQQPAQEPAVEATTELDTFGPEDVEAAGVTANDY